MPQSAPVPDLAAERLTQLERAVAKYAVLPPECVIKEELLKTGLRFRFEAPQAFKEKSYFIFSFDMVKLKDNPQSQRVPEEIALSGGPFDLRRTIVSVRQNPRSPYEVVISPEGNRLEVGDQRLADVALPPPAPYYDRTLANGKPVHEVAPTIEWGYLVYLTVYRLCQYFNADEACKFCEMNPNFYQQKQAGRTYSAVKSPEEVVEAMRIVAESESAAHAYTVTGGSIIDGLAGLSEVDFYARYAEAIEQALPGRFIAKAVVQAMVKTQVQKLYDAGYRIYHPNFEVWDKRLFEQICTGKDRVVGRDEWIRRLVDAVDVFGPGRVIPNFVAGIEMARPYGFERVADAVESTVTGLDYLMARGVVPRFTTWCPEPLTPLGEANPDGAPLEYHLEMVAAYRDAILRHKLPAPPGYGEPGAGRAVFSVSSFMDALPAEAP
ncbi:MAG TPA: radical SAM protein [Limnochordia bacterium]|nr:radical SAM protein [Limnochordia bacterium]